MSLVRINDYMLRLENRYCVPVRILANEHVKIEKSAAEELEQLHDAIDPIFQNTKPEQMSLLESKRGEPATS